MKIINKLRFVRHTNPVSDHKFTNNYEGTSGGIKVSGVLSSFNHSLRTKGIYHTKSLGDGDSTAQQRVVIETPCEPNIPVTRLECIGYVQKRMGARLKNL
jgi:hypothetical protein